MNYVDAINKVLLHEGGFVNDPNDSGGATNWGITQKVYEGFKGRPVTLTEMKSMPKADAITIYKRDYWDKIGGDQIKSYNVAYAIFDQAVNRGVSAAVKAAQAIVGTTQDGKIGPATLALINSMNEKSFLEKYLAQAISFYRTIASNDGPNDKDQKFLQGWLNRISSLSDYVGVKPAVAASGIFLFLVAGFFLLQLLNSSKRRTA